MLPIIGIIVAAYVATRSLELLTREGRHPAVRLFASATVVLAVVGIGLLINSATEVNAAFKSLGL